MKSPSILQDMYIAPLSIPDMQACTANDSRQAIDRALAHGWLIMIHTTVNGVLYGNSVTLHELDTPES